MTRWIRGLNFSTKLVAIAIAAVVPVLILTALFLSDKQNNINLGARELSGLHRYQKLEAMLLPLGMHEVWSIAAAAGEGVSDKLQAASAEVTRQMNLQDAANDDYGAPAMERRQRRLERARHNQAHIERRRRVHAQCAAAGNSRLSRLHCNHFGPGSRRRRCDVVRHRRRGHADSGL
jgi:hypothetical protein